MPSNYILSIQRCLLDPKNTFQTINHVSGHFRPDFEPEYQDSDMQKRAIFPKNAKNSNLVKLAGSPREVIIWPEMDT